MRGLQSSLAALLALATLATSAWAEATPACRLDDEGAKTVETALRLATGAYANLGKRVPFDQVVVNPKSHTGNPRTLEVLVVSDASASKVNKAGCIVGKPGLVNAEELDNYSVRGGCIAVAGTTPKIRCSSEAVQIFGDMPERKERSNPALLYILAHELGHILQRRPGEYAGRVEPIKLELSQEAKLETLRESCEPGMTKAEEDADRLAVQVLTRLLPDPPYGEPMFSAQGSVLWGVDQLNLAANNWRKTAIEREFISQAKPHKSFVSMDFPTPMPKVNANAKRFVCDVLTKKVGTVLYPGRATTHPPLEVRMQRVVQALRSVAAGLPKTGEQQEYKPIAILQEQLSDIFTFMYRETGVYLEAVQSAICTRVNSDKPAEGCVAGH